MTNQRTLQPNSFAYLVRKNTTVDQMERAFNSEYDSLLALYEASAQDKASEAYAMVLQLHIEAQNNPSRLTELNSRINEILTVLVSDIYNDTATGFGSWYFEAFGHLMSEEIDLDTLNAFFASAVANAASNRALVINNRISSTIERRVINSNDPSELSMDGMAGSFARTETNGAAGLGLDEIAGIMFADAILYKRWVTVGDERVRNTHRIAGSMRPIPRNQLYSVGDTFMRFPADPQAFGGNVAGEVINCRCRSLLVPRIGGGQAVGSNRLIL